MRVLFIANYFPPYGFVGGAEVANYHTCQGLLGRGVDCHFLALNHRLPEAFDRLYTLDGIPVHWVSLRARKRRALTDIYDHRAYRVVRKELARIRPDVVHVHNVSGATLAPYVACRAAGVQVVNTLHDLWLLCPNNMLYRPGGVFCDPARRPPRCSECFTRYDFWAYVPWRRTLFRALTRDVKVFISPSQAYINQHVRAGYDPERFRLVPYGLSPTATLDPCDARAAEVAGTADLYYTLVFAAGGYEHKGAAVLLQAAPKLLREVERLRIVIAGGGDGALLAAFRDLSPRVQVVGSLPAADMRAVFASADLTAVPSVWYDNSPVVIYENLQVGTPVVGSQMGGIPELIREGQTGYTFPAGDADALAERVTRHFALSPRERRHMRRQCVEESRTRLGHAIHTEAILAIYREVLGR